MEGHDQSAQIVGLTGVYDADGSLAGELSYWIGARLGRRHCALCDITHGLVREKPEWKDVLDRLPVEFDAVHIWMSALQQSRKRAAVMSHAWSRSAWTGRPRS